MQPEMLMCSRPRSRAQIELAEPPGDLLGDRNRTRIGEAAIIEAGAGNDIGHQSDIGRCDADRVERAPQLRQVALRNVRQHQVLLVADADLAERVAVGEIGDGVHLRGGGVARCAAFGLERQRHDGVARDLVIGDRVAHPGGEARVGAAGLGKLGRAIIEPLIVRIN